MDITNKLLSIYKLFIDKNQQNYCATEKPKKRHYSQQTRSLKCFVKSRAIVKSVANKQAKDGEKPMHTTCKQRGITEHY